MQPWQFGLAGIGGFFTIIWEVSAGFWQGLTGSAARLCTSSPRKLVPSCQCIGMRACGFPDEKVTTKAAKLPMKFAGLSRSDAWPVVQIEGQQMERNQNQQEKAALAKLERIKLDQGKRAEDLERDAVEAESKVSTVRMQFAMLDAIAHVGLQSLLQRCSVSCRGAVAGTHAETARTYG